MDKIKGIVVALLIIGGVFWWALSPHEHMRHPMQPLPRHLDPAVLGQVGASYVKDVQPIFKGACFDCHTTQTVWPWYHAVPGVRQFLDGHVEDGRRALDMSKGFPFDQGPKVLKDLRRIAGNVQRGDMPLWSYKLMHPDARLTDAQRQVIVRWAQDGYDRLTSTASAESAPLDQKRGGRRHHGEKAS